MKGDNSPTNGAGTGGKKENPETGSLSRKKRYKFWLLAAIILLAFWSMFTGSVSLKWSAVNFTRFHDGPKSPIFDDLDILEVEEREKVVKQMWNVYTHSGSGNGRLRKFWLEAFEAGYDNLVSEIAEIRDAALLEIAKMSLQLQSIPTPSPLHSKDILQSSRKLRSFNFKQTQ